MSNQIYTADQIASLNPIEACRKRPTMYMGELGIPGVNHLLKEVVTNSIDEFLQGYGQKISIHINATNPNAPTFCIRDWGRGIPHEKLVDSVSKLHTSGKYSDIDGKGGKGYLVSGGVNGVGLKLANFLSTHFKAISYRDGERWEIRFEEGQQIGEVDKRSADGSSLDHGPSGTIIEYTLDHSCLGDVNITDRKQEFATYLQIMAYINPGIHIEFCWNKDKPISFCHPDGVIEYFDKLIRERKFKVIGEGEHIQFKSADFSYAYDIAFGICERGSGYEAFTNGIPNSEGGVHVSALYEALGVLTSELNKRNFFTKKEVEKGFKITGGEIRDTLFAVVIADKTAPQFATQVKSKFTSEDYRALVIGPLKNDIAKWIARNSKTVDKIGEHLANIVRANAKAAEARGNVLKSGTSHVELMKIDASKFQDCNCRNKPELNELFICEGNSAATPLISTRNPEHQAVYAIRGKTKNAIKSDVLSDEQKVLISVLGTGVGVAKDIRKLRYHKVIITCDKDDDGAHIQSLMIAFFNRWFPELIQNGHIYIANPPLYTLRTNGKNIYINNYEQLSDNLSKFAMSIFELVDSKGRTLPDGVTKYYMRPLPRYTEIIDECAKMLAIDPLLLEVTVLDYENLMKKNFKKFEGYGFTVDNYLKVPGAIKLGVSSGYNHYFLQIDKTFVDTMLNPIRQYLREQVIFSGLRFRGKKSKHLYSTSYYEQGKLVNNILFGPQAKVEVSRSKGLGSMEAHELYETAVNPETRYLTNLRIKQYSEARTNEIVENMFTSSQEKKDIVNARLNMVD